jgi:molybdate transport system substrate-binding protein
MRAILIRLAGRRLQACCWYALVAALVPLTAVAQSCIQDESVYPPWQHGANNDALERGLEFTVPDADNLADFHGDPGNPLLVLYVGGNYFFAMAPLVQTFESRFPHYKGRLFWETLPPGLLIKQMQAAGRVTVGNMSWTARADVYLAGLQLVQRQIDAGLLSGPAAPYVTNTLTIMVPKGNPAQVHSLADLGRPDIRLAMPNPEFEGVAQQIRESLTKAGGAELAKTVYETKVQHGTTLLTRIHHRQTPLWLMQCKAQAGVTWKSEAIFQEEIGHPIEHVDIPAAQNATGVYAAALAKDAPHAQAARDWLEFLRSAQALEIFKRYGFQPYVPAH